MVDGGDNNIYIYILHGTVQTFLTFYEKTIGHIQALFDYELYGEQLSPIKFRLCA